MELRVTTVIALVAMLIGDGLALAAPANSSENPRPGKSSGSKTSCTLEPKLDPSGKNKTKPTVRKTKPNTRTTKPFAKNPKPTVKNTLPECITQLSKAQTFDDGTPGESGISPNYQAYAEACGMVGTLETEDLEWLMENGTPAGRLYGAMLMKHTGRAGDAESFKRLEKDDSQVTVLCGCKGTQSCVSDIAREFMANGQFLSFKLWQFCKMKAPTQEK